MKKDLVLGIVIFAAICGIENAVFFGYNCNKMHKQNVELCQRLSEAGFEIDSLEKSNAEMAQKLPEQTTVIPTYKKIGE